MLQEKSYFPALTGLRAIAALYVYFNHRDDLRTYGGVAERLLNELHIGVGIFFVLSGFLITWHNAEKRTQQSFNRGEYLLKRWARIYPLWLLLTLITLGYEWYQCWGECFSWRYLLLNLTLTQAYFSDALFTGIAQGWSLCIELVFYLMAILLVHHKRYIPWVVPVALLCGWLYTCIGSLYPSLSLLQTPQQMLLYTFFGRALEFMTGAWLAEKLFTSDTVKISATKPVYTLMGATGLLLSPVILMYANAEVSSSIYSIYGIALQHILMSGFVGVLIWGLCTEYSWLRKILSSTVMEYAGKASYAFYLIHIGILHKLLHFSPWLEFPVLCLISLLLFLWVEDPLRKWITRRYSA